MRDLINLTSNDGSDFDEHEGIERFLMLYLSCSAGNPGPAPKIGFLSALSANSDAVIARGVDRWVRVLGAFLPCPSTCSELQDMAQELLLARQVLELKSLPENGNANTEIINRWRNMDGTKWGIP